MGKKSYEDLDYFQKRKKILKMAEGMGIDKNDYNYLNSGRGGRPGEYGPGDPKPDFEQMEKDVSRAMHDNYDVRRSLEAARLSATDEDEKEKLGKLATGISDIGEGYDVYKWMKNTHEDVLNNGGAFTSENDYAGITDHFVNRDRDNLLASIEEMSGGKDPEEEDGPEIERWSGGKSYNDYMENTFGADRADEIARGWVGETVKATSGFSAGAQEGAGGEAQSAVTQDEAAAQSLLNDTVKKIMGDRGAMEGAKADQGKYVLRNLRNGVF